MQGPELERQLGYWRGRLENLTPLELATDRPCPPMVMYTGSAINIPLDPDLGVRLEQLGRREGTTLFMTMFAAFVTLLHRYSGQDDIAVAVPIANREQLALEPLVGAFVNTVVMRASVSHEQPFTELLARVRETALGAFAFQDLPFERLVEELRPPRDSGRPPLAQVIFTLQNAPGEGLKFDDILSESVPIDRGASQFEIGFYIDTTIEHRMQIEYNSILFDRSTIERLVQHYLVLLESVIDAPATPVGGLAMLPAAEARWLVHTLNATDAAYPAEAVLHQLIEAQVDRTPDAPAVTCGGAALTYRELNARANQLARRLGALGVGRGTLVALSVARGLGLPVALLAIQKAGAAYLPLDPAFPPERLGFMLTDSGAAVLITSENATPPNWVVAGVRTVDLLGEAETLGTLDASNVAPSAGPDDLAYVLYTSGSTGRPKGVEVRQRALVNLLWSMMREPGLSARDVFAAVTTISFDIAGLELYLPLIAGARVELVSREDASSGTALAECLARSGATIMQATPATWRMLVEAGWTGAPGFRALCGGEALPRDLANALLERAEQVWNLYGPTGDDDLVDGGAGEPRWRADPHRPSHCEHPRVRRQSGGGTHADGCPG